MGGLGRTGSGDRRRPASARGEGTSGSLIRPGAVCARDSGFAKKGLGCNGCWVRRSMGYVDGCLWWALVVLEGVVYYFVGWEAGEWGIGSHS